MILFGSFRLLAAERRLYDGEKEMRLGGRAFELLLALTARPGDVISKRELLAAAWPDSFAEEATLRVHIAGLRKALGDGQAGARYILNETGRGYRFVGTLRHVSTPPQASTTEAPARPPGNLPARLFHAIGRDETSRLIAEKTSQTHFVTIVGTGGAGKSTVALLVAEATHPNYGDGAWFVDGASLSDETDLGLALAATFGLVISQIDPMTALVNYLRNRHALILLDNCERIITRVAELAEAILKGCPRVHLLATSREPIRAEGEWLHRLEPLPAPLRSDRLTAEAASAFPAVQLFVERACAAWDQFRLTDQDAPVVGELCRRLGGLPLAIELAAARARDYGASNLLQNLEGRFMLLAQGRRTAPARQRTMQAVLDWSYNLLTPEERAVVRRLSAFRASFSLRSAVALCGGNVSRTAAESPSNCDIESTLVALAEKSLIVVDVAGSDVQYRLLELTATYARGLTRSLHEHDEAQRAHAVHMCDLLAESEADWDHMTRSAWLATYGPLMEDLRAALRWAFGDTGDRALGVRLSSLAVPLGLQLSLVAEMKALAEHALDEFVMMTEQRREPSVLLQHMRLSLALAVLSQGAAGSPSSRIALYARPVRLARELRSPRHRIEPLIGIAGLEMALGLYRPALSVARHAGALASVASDSGAMLAANRIRAQALHFTGQHAQSQQIARQILRRPPLNLPLATSQTPIDLRVSMMNLDARVTWLLGFPEQSMAIAARSVELAARDGPFSLCQSLALAACPVAFWCGDREQTEAYVARLIDEATRCTLDQWLSWGRWYKAALRPSAAELAHDEDGALPPLSGHLQTETLVTLGLTALLPEATARLKDNLSSWVAPELLRRHAIEGMQRNESAGKVQEAERHLLHSLSVARGHGALGWELRIATSLASIGPPSPGQSTWRSLLEEVLARFQEGGATADLRAASDCLAQQTHPAS